MVGFGVGLSWAGCTWTETWQPKHVPGEGKKGTHRVVTAAQEVA